MRRQKRVKRTRRKPFIEPEIIERKPIRKTIRQECYAVTGVTCLPTT